MFSLNSLSTDCVFDESVADLQLITKSIVKVSETTKNNLIKMNDEFLESVNRNLHKSYSCNTILVDDHGFSLFENCMIVQLFRRIRLSVQTCIQ